MSHYTSARHKRVYFVIEALNALATTYYGYYLFFFLRKEFGFGDLPNLAFGALFGLVFAVAAWQGGRFAQKFGYFRALKTGFVVMTASLLSGLVLPGIWGQTLVMVVWTIGMCFTWPTLEGLVSENENPRRLKMLIGIYNVVWSGAAAVAYFFGGALIDFLGTNSLFYIPAVIHVGQFFMVRWIERWPASEPAPSSPADAAQNRGYSGDHRPPSRVPPKVFLKLAWIGNPFAYVAINTVLAVIPRLAQQLHLSTASAGVFCSVWLFARMGSFALLWVWQGWHYRFGWFIGAYLVIIASFLALLLGHSLALVVAAQLAFGAAVGLIYYSSLFYPKNGGWIAKLRPARWRNFPPRLGFS